jgi:hypothetical protein
VRSLLICASLAAIACVCPSVASAMTCQEFHRGYLFGNFDVLKQAAELMQPVNEAESTDIPTDPRLLDLFLKWKCRGWTPCVRTFLTIR